MSNPFNAYNYLYVEDDPLSQEVMCMIMENAMGVENLTIFSDSRDFLQRIHALEQPPDVILLDIHVTPIDGFTMLAELRADGAFQNTRIIALTASVMNEEIDRLRHSGFDSAIGKPLSVRTFPDLMTRIMAGETIWHVT